jgi:OOP family OmpA-OmpF porin
MRFSYLVVGCWVLMFSSLVSATDWYAGTNYSYLKLDGDRSTPCDCDIESDQIGIKIGRYVYDNISLEVDYSTSIAKDNLNAASVTGIFWSDNQQSPWRYFALVGLSHNNFDNELVTDNYDDNSTQFVFGLGVGKQVATDYQVRADMRLMGGPQFEDEDIGFQLSFNRFLGTSKAPAVPEKITPEVVAAPKVKTITISLNVEFEFDKATVLTIYSEQLATIAAAMQAHNDIELVLEGHTDSVGTDAYNADLSLRRAEAVKQKLSVDYAIDVSRISTHGYGESRPIASNDNDQGRARNRRVVGEMSFTEIVVD